MAMIQRLRRVSSRDDIFSLFGSRGINAIWCGILPCQSRRGFRYDGVPVDQLGVSDSRNGVTLLSDEI
jgi:hypothetical protein